MNKTVCTLALGAALALGASGAALAQVCPPGYTPRGATCYASATGPVEGAANLAAGTANATGNAAGGAVNAAGTTAGGASNAGGQVVVGTAGALTGQPPKPAPTARVADEGRCGPGWVLYQGSCFPDPNR